MARWLLIEGEHRGRCHKQKKPSRSRIMDDAKIYNVCLMRVKFQITNAKQRLGGTVPPGGRLALESYNTGDIDDIIDILEIYDLEDRTQEGLSQKLEDLAYTVSVLVRETIAFDYDLKGNLGLYLLLKEKRPVQEITVADAALSAA
ncbi:MAG: hypothetical protein HZA15_07270 [Nitrospirae bacterium]|nr:hypothetical protein [Nitrospirota bacterium]